MQFIYDGSASQTHTRFSTPQSGPSSADHVDIIGSSPSHQLQTSTTSSRQPVVTAPQSPPSRGAPNDRQVLSSTTSRDVQSEKPDTGWIFTFCCKHDLSLLQPIELTTTTQSTPRILRGRNLTMTLGCGTFTWIWQRNTTMTQLGGTLLRLTQSCFSYVHFVPLQSHAQVVTGRFVFCGGDCLRHRNLWCHGTRPH